MREICVILFCWLQSLQFHFFNFSLCTYVYIRVICVTWMKLGTPDDSQNMFVKSPISFVSLFRRVNEPTVKPPFERHLNYRIFTKASRKELPCWRVRHYHRICGTMLLPVAAVDITRRIIIFTLLTKDGRRQLSNSCSGQVHWYFYERFFAIFFAMKLLRRKIAVRNSQ